MKKLLYILLFLSPSLLWSQGYTIESQPVCWSYLSVDSSLVQYSLASSTATSTKILFYLNASGATVDVSAGGTLTFGLCDCGSGGSGNVVAINGLSNVSSDTIQLGGTQTANITIDGDGFALSISGQDSIELIATARLRLNSVFFPRNDGFDGQALVYDAAGDSLAWATISGENIYNADGAQTHQIRTDTLGGKTLVFDGRTGTGDTSTMIRMLADYSSDDAKTTFLSLETGAAGTPTDSLIFYDYDTSFKIESSSNLNIIADNFLQLDTDSMHLSINGNYGGGPGTYFIDQRVTPRGIEYQSLDYIPTLSDSSLIPKIYSDSNWLAPRLRLNSLVESANNNSLRFTNGGTFSWDGLFSINSATALAPFYAYSNNASYATIGLLDQDFPGYPSRLLLYNSNNSVNHSLNEIMTEAAFAGYYNSTKNPNGQIVANIEGVYRGTGTQRYGGLVFNTWGAASKRARLFIDEAGYVTIADNASPASGALGYRLGIRSHSSDTSIQFNVVDSSLTTKWLLYVRGNGNVGIQDYPNSRDDAGTPTNFLATSATGELESHPITEITLSPDVFYGQTASTNETYTTLRPTEHWSSVFSTGCGSCVTLQGDTAFVFNQTGVFDVEFNLILYSLVTSSVFTIQEGNVTGTISSFGLDWDGHTVVNDGQEYTVKYRLNVTAAPASFTLDITGDGTGTTVRTGSRVSITKLY